LGFVQRAGCEAVACYDHQSVIAALMRDGMSWQEAEEYFSFNQIGAWVGDATPCFLTKAPEDCL